MQFNARMVFRYILLLAVSAGLLWFIFRNENWGEFWADIKSCRWGWVAAMMLLQCLVTLMRGERWRLMMRPLTRDLTVRETYDAYAICYLSNLLIPRSGEVVRCGLVAETRKTSFEGALGSVVMERVWDIICVIVSCIPLLFVGHFREIVIGWFTGNDAPAGGNALMWLWIGLALAAVVVVAVILARRHRESLNRTKIGAAIFGFCGKMAEGFKAAFKMERKWAFFGYTILIWVSYWLCSLWTIWALPSADAAGLGGWDALFLMIVGSIGWLVPVPGGFGAYHGILSLTLGSIYGLAMTEANAFAVLSHETQVVQMLVIGLISLATWAIVRRRRARSMTNTSQSI